MPTINGLTAERMLAIEAASIVDGHVVGDNLILTKHGGDTVDAGPVRGPTGSPGMSIEEMNALLDTYDPVGIAKAYTGSVEPAGHAFCDAGTQHSAATYPKLAALYGTGAGCVNGACASGYFLLPNLKGKFLVGVDNAVTAFNLLRKTGGSKDAIVVTHNHTATQATHNHGGTTTTDGLHSHSVDGGDFGDRIVISYGASTGITVGTAGPSFAAFTSLEENGSHFHTIPNDTPAVTVNNNGASGTDKNLPPYYALNYIMRLA